MAYIVMDRPLFGRVILVIEDEPLVALDIRQTFEDAGATAVLVRTLAAALIAVEDPTLSAAIVDHALGDGDSSALCQRLNERNVPFVVYSGYPTLSGPCAAAEHVSKPATPAVLVCPTSARVRQI